jgi:hypothetical protein
MRPEKSSVAGCTNEHWHWDVGLCAEDPDRILRIMPTADCETCPLEFRVPDRFFYTTHRSGLIDGGSENSIVARLSGPEVAYCNL